MNFLKRLPRHFTYIFTSLFTGIFVFLIISGIYFDRSVFNEEFHQQLFAKNNIYSHMHSVINSSMDEFVSNLKKSSPKSYEDQKGVFNVFEKSFTLEMVHMNLDTLSSGILQYIRGEKKTLPDIYLNPQKSALSQNSGNTGGSGDSTSQALEKVDKINLGAILIYINRNDITDDLSIFKFLYYLITTVPELLFLFILLFTLIGIVLCKNFLAITNWIFISMLTSGVLGILSGIILMAYTHMIMPAQIIPLTMSLPLQNVIITSYLTDCTTSVSIFLIIFGISLILLPILLRLCLRKLYTVFKKDEHFVPIPNDRMQAIIRNSVYSLLFVLIITSISYKFYTLKQDFKTNEFQSVIVKMKNPGTVTQVISAQDETFYSLNIKLNDGKTEMPISNTQINISGKSDLLKKNFNETVSTDYQGVARYKLDKGTYRLSFIPANFPQNYRIPSPFFFEIKSAGTTILTVNIDTIPEIIKQLWGIVELEILDKDNKSVSNLELSLKSNTQVLGYPEYLYSITNSEGIAVFKINEGTYSINFTQSKFPEKYVLPSVIDADVKAGATTRYTIRLSELKPPESAPKKATFNTPISKEKR